jgi:energy-coupling factor transport system substrate-specific component
MVQFRRTLPYLAALFGIVAITWPLYISGERAALINQLAIPVLMSAVIPIALLLFSAEIIGSFFSARRLAIIAALTSVAMVVRVLGAGVAGIEPIWTIVIISGFALGAASGFVVGVSAIALSALATGGIGPWLPYQMVTAGTIGVVAGILRTATNQPNRLVLGSTGFIAGVLYGWVMNLWFWPTAIGLQAGLAYNPDAEISERLLSWIRFNLATSLGFDLPRGLLTAGLLVWIGPRMLSAIQRAARIGNISVLQVVHRP